jgi:hypothetical protein
MTALCLKGAFLVGGPGSQDMRVGMGLLPPVVVPEDLLRASHEQSFLRLFVLPALGKAMRSDACLSAYRRGAYRVGFEIVCIAEANEGLRDQLTRRRRLEGDYYGTP